jgi:hypothetical protein
LVKKEKPFDKNDATHLYLTFFVKQVRFKNRKRHTITTLREQDQGHAEFIQTGDGHQYDG